MADRLPELVEGVPGRSRCAGGSERDAEILGEAVIESIEHLRPWMPWAAHEPLSVVERRALIGKWERDWLVSGDVVMGIFVNGSAALGADYTTRPAQAASRSTTGRAPRSCAPESRRQPLAR